MKTLVFVIAVLFAACGKKEEVKPLEPKKFELWYDLEAYLPNNDVIETKVTIIKTDESGTSWAIKNITAKGPVQAIRFDTVIYAAKFIVQIRATGATKKVTMAYQYDGKDLYRNLDISSGEIQQGISTEHTIE